MAGRDQLAEMNLIRDIVKNLAQIFSVAAIGRGGDAEDFTFRVKIENVVDDAPITGSHRVVRFVNHKQIEFWHCGQIGGTRQCWHHRKSRLTGPVFSIGVDNRGGQLGVDPGKFVPVLGSQLVTMGQNAGLGVRPFGGPRNNGRQRDRFAESGGSDTKRVAVVVERSKAALHKEFLTGAKQHGQTPIAPRTADQCPTVPLNPVSFGNADLVKVGAAMVPPHP